jgi:HAD superfamily hydrolase (TIGR01450 family)
MESAVSRNLPDRLRRIRHVALDMDGTLYRGRTLFPFTNPALALFTELGVSWSFLTNNSSKGAADYVTHLNGLGLAVAASQIHTSAQATVEYLRSETPGLRRLFLIGTTSLEREFREAGFELTSDSAADRPDAVLVGFDLDPKFTRLCRAAYWIKEGLPFIATHPDRVCPTDEPTVLIDCGAICAALTAATGRTPDAVPGKPDPRMLLGLGRRLGLRPDEMAMVGDRLYTDVEMALRAGALGVLVLSGEATPGDVAASARKPDLVVRDLAEFGELLRLSRS